MQAGDVLSADVQISEEPFQAVGPVDGTRSRGVEQLVNYIH
jgi:hypothetical protein